jgi:hypothetical protein
MGLTTSSDFEERRLSELNATAEAMSMRDAGDWEEAIDWGVPDYSTVCPSEWRALAAPEYD